MIKRKSRQNPFQLFVITVLIYNDYGLQFESPTINLFFFAKDYIRFLESGILYK
jgi:uncharacterized protein (DUF1919 family)